MNHKTEGIVTGSVRLMLPNACYSEEQAQLTAMHEKINRDDVGASDTLYEQQSPQNASTVPDSLSMIRPNGVSFTSSTNRPYKCCYNEIAENKSITGNATQPPDSFTPQLTLEDVNWFHQRRSASSISDEVHLSMSQMEISGEGSVEERCERNSADPFLGHRYNLCPASLQNTPIPEETNESYKQNKHHKHEDTVKAIATSSNRGLWSCRAGDDSHCESRRDAALFRTVSHLRRYAHRQALEAMMKQLRVHPLEEALAPI